MSLAVWSWPLFLAPDGTDHYLTHSLLAAALIQHNHIDFRVHTATCCSERDDGKTTDTFLIRVCDAHRTAES